MRLRMYTTKTARTGMRRACRVIALLAVLTLLTLSLGYVIGTSDNSAVAAPQSLLAPKPPLLKGTLQDVNVGPGQQFDPHIDGNLVSYTDVQGPISNIRYFDFTTNIDNVIPVSGVSSSSDVNGSRISFTNLNAVGSQVFVYDTANGSYTAGGVNQTNSAIGGNIVAFENRGFSPNPNQSEIVAMSFNPLATIRLTDDSQRDDLSPAVSPAGDAVAFVKCEATGFGCDIYVARETEPGVFTTSQLTGVAGEESTPDTNGEVVVYTSKRDSETDIFFQPINGGAETQIPLTGQQRNPSISGNLIAFESPTAEGTFDIYVYDISTAKLYRATRKPLWDPLSDISVSNGQARIVYGTWIAGGTFDVFAFTFTVPIS